MDPTLCACRPPADEKVAVVNDSVASGNDSMLGSGDVTMDSIKEHAKYVFENVTDKLIRLEW